MKNVCFKALLSFITFLLAVSGALAFEPALTLKDKERGTEVNLYPIPGKEGEGLLFYGNDRFGYSVEVPYELFSEVVTLPDNADGIILASKDGKARFRVSGGNVMDEDTLRSAFEKAKQSVGKDFVFENLTEDSWRLCWWDGDRFFQRKFVVNEEVWAECEVSYPSSRDEGSRSPWDDLAFQAVESLALGME